MYVAAVGGDVFGLHRFVVPVMPIWAALAASGLDSVWNIGGIRPRLILRLGLVAITVFFAIGCYRDFVLAQSWGAAERRMVEWQSNQAAFLRKECNRNESIATIGIGVLGYATDLRIIDMLGLVDTHIAHRKIEHFGSGLPGHEKFDSEYVLDQAPRFIMIPGPPGSAWTRVNAVIDMWNNPRFLAEYEWIGRGFRRKAKS